MMRTIRGEETIENHSPARVSHLRKWAVVNFQIQAYLDRMNPQERFKIAAEKFENQHPEVRRELDAITVVEAEASGLTLEEFRARELSKKLDIYAETQGVEPAIYLIQLAASNDSERREWLTEHHKGIAAAMGVSWDQYLHDNSQLREIV